MLHKTIKAPPLHSLDKVKVESRLFDLKQSFYNLKWERLKSAELIEIYEKLLGLSPPDSLKFLENHEAMISNQARTHKNLRARNIYRQLKCVKKFRAPWITAQQGLSVNGDFFVQSIRMNGIVRKMKNMGFDSFSVADLMYPDTHKTLIYLSMLIHIHDELIPALTQTYKTKLESSDFFVGRDHPDSKWISVNTEISEAKHLREQLLNQLEEHRSKEATQIKEIHELEDLYDNSNQELNQILKNTKLISDQTEAIKQEIRDMQDRMREIETEINDYHERSKGILSYNELQDWSRLATDEKERIEQEKHQVNEALVKAKQILDLLMEEDEWLHDIVIGQRVTNLKKKIDLIIEKLEQGKQFEDDVAEGKKTLDELQQKEKEVEEALEFIRKVREEERDGGAVRKRMLSLKKELVLKQQRLEELDTIAEEKKKEGKQIKVSMREKENILRELEGGKINLVRRFDSKMLGLKALIDALMALSLSTARHHLDK